MTDLHSHLLIEASAGTGKTYTLEQIILQLILQEKKQLSEILAITFTEKAAWELKKRIRNKISEERFKASPSELIHLQNALNDFDNAQIHTFHAFCFKTLKEFGLETGFCNGTPSPDMDPFIHKLLHDFFRIHSVSPEAYEDLLTQFKNLEKIHDLIKKLLSSGVTLQSLQKNPPASAVVLSPDYESASSVPQSSWKLFYDILEFILLKLEDLKLEKEILSYDDMIRRIHEALVLKPQSSIHKALTQRFHYVIIDEFQDTDKIQWEIFHSLCMTRGSDSRLILVGDPKQSIYRFRNSDLNTYFRAKSLISSHRSLKINYRSSPSMIRAFNSLFLLRPLFKKGMDFLVSPPEGSADSFLFCEGKKLPPVHFWKLPEQKPLDDLRECIARDVAAKISRWITSPLPLTLVGSQEIKLRWKDIAILCMKNDQCKMFQEILSESGIPSIITDHKGLLSTKETEDTLYFLRAVKNPEDKSDVRKALSSLYFDISFKKLCSATEEEFSDWQKLFYDFNQFYIQNGTPALLNEMLFKTRIIPKSLLKLNGERTASSLKQLYQFLTDSVLQKSCTLDALIEYLDHLRLDPPSIPLQIDRETDCVQIMTLHASKGLQFPVVFLGSVFFKSLSTRQEGLCYFSDHDRTFIDLEYSPDSEKRHQDEKTEEYKRLLYVAMTRAQYLLYMPLYLPRQKNFISLPNFLWPEGKNFDELVHDLSSSPELFEVEDILETSSVPVHPPSLGMLKDFIPPFPDFSMTPHLVPYTSFSSLSSEDKDLDDSPLPPPASEVSSSLLPPGSKTGLLLHDLLEQVEFDWFKEPFISFDPSFISLQNSQLHELLSQRIALHDFHPSSYPEILRILWNTLNTPLPSPQEGFRLCDIREKHSELEFLLPLDPAINKAVNLSLPPMRKVSYAFDSRAQFLKGFIDLLFFYKNQYFIVDWKSNDLGNSPEHYRYEPVVDDLVRHRYPLQFMLYTAALYQYLKLHDSEKKISSLFGGVYYLYLRGMDGTSENGVFYHRPQKDEILTVLNHLKVIPHD